MNITLRGTFPTPIYQRMMAERVERKPCDRMVLSGELTRARRTPCGDFAKKCLECADRRLYGMIEERRRRKEEERERRCRMRDGVWRQGDDWVDG
jgi:hypothetical protein